MTEPHHPMSAIGTLEVERGGDFLEVRASAERSPVANAVPACAAVLGGAFIAFALPSGGAARAGNLLWIGAGSAALAVVAGLALLRGRLATLRLDGFGLSAVAGRPLDQTRDAIAWADLAGVEVEAVDERKPKRGVKLRLSRAGDGEPVDALPGVAGIAELTEVRRLVIDAWRERRPDAAR